MPESQKVLPVLVARVLGWSFPLVLLLALQQFQSNYHKTLPSDRRMLLACPETALTCPRIDFLTIVVRFSLDSVHERQKTISRALKRAFNFHRARRLSDIRFQHEHEYRPSRSTCLRSAWTRMCSVPCQAYDRDTIMSEARTRDFGSYFKRCFPHHQRGY